MAFQQDPELNRYIKKVRSIPKLSRAQEHELAIQAQTGDQTAIDQLVQANLRYAVDIALQYRRYPIRLADLIAEGNVGLITAVKSLTLTVEPVL